MPRYFFDFIDSGKRSRDDEGVELASWTAPITAILVGSEVMGLKIRVPMQPLMECVIAKTNSRGLRSQAGTYFVRSQMKRRML